jgi:hypothetical protein
MRGFFSEDLGLAMKINPNNKNKRRRREMI